MITVLTQQLRALTESPPAKTKESKARVKKYYDKCMKRKDDAEYCARVAWSIYCAHVNPKYKGCTGYGKRWGRPYSEPIGD
jgi:hypothetical protein